MKKYTCYVLPIFRQTEFCIIKLFAALGWFIWYYKHHFSTAANSKWVQNFLWCVFYFPKRVWTTVGGRVVKVLILQFFLDMEMVCTWSHKSRLSKILHFLHRCCLFPRMPYFLFSILEKKKCLYTMILMPAMNSALYCRTCYHMYIWSLFDKFIVFFTISCVSR